ncbi:MAG: M6 family metalloprotease domain-containing protein [Gemmatimonas sp.]
MRDWVRHIATFSLAFLAVATRATAQDIESRAARSGHTLPPAYFARIRANPSFFELAAGWRRRMARAVESQVAVEGSLPIAVIPVRFAGGAAVPAAVATSVLQAKLFDGPATSTISGYFTEVSRGLLTMRGRVGQWVPTSLTIAEVTGSSRGLGGDARVGEWLRQAIAATDAAFDFAEFDNDGPDGRPNSGDDDGRVDGAAFLFHERDAACGGPGIWPHRSRVSGWGGGPAVTKDIGASGRPIEVDDYIVLGAMDCNNVGPLESNVFAHEMGHVLGLPDYYDSSGGLLREQRRWVVGCWELMSGGAWGCGTGPQPASLSPPHLGPHPKTTLNWVAPVVVGSSARNQEFVLRPVRVSGDVLRLNLSAREYLLVEYRDRGGFDAALPASGVLVYHVETNRAFVPCATCIRTYSYSLLEGDGNDGLVRPETLGGNRGEAGDAFQTGREITSVTNPSTARNDGTRTTVSIHSIVVDPLENVARLTVTTAVTPLALLDGIAVARRYASFSTSFPITGGAAPYAVTVEGLPAGVVASIAPSRVTLAGEPTVAGTFLLGVTIRDALGTTSMQASTLTVASPYTYTTSSLMRAVGDNGASLAAEERGYLDAQGNRNGRIDVGDVRAYLRRAGN